MADKEDQQDSGAVAIEVPAKDRAQEDEETESGKKKKKKGNAGDDDEASALSEEDKLLKEALEMAVQRCSDPEVSISISTDRNDDSPIGT